MIWLQPENIILNWRPENYSSEFTELDKFLSTNAVFQLGQYFKVFIPYQEEINVKNKWMPFQAKNQIDLTKHRGIENKRISNLPGEAIIIGKWFHERLPVMYWSEAIFGEGCYLLDDVIVLIPKSDLEFAWIAEELEAEYVQLQIRRSVSNRHSVFLPPRINIEMLLNLRIKHISNTEESKKKSENKSKLFARSLNDKIAHDSALNEVKFTFLTGATFEERLTQFEEYLLQQNFIDHNKAFFIEWTDNDKTVNSYMARPLRGVNVKAINRGPIEFQSDNEIHTTWRKWIDSIDDVNFKILNIGSNLDGIPSFVNENTIKYLISDDDFKMINGIVIPSYETYLDIIQILSENNILSNHEKIFYEKNDISNWITNHSLSELLTIIYSPVIAIKILRDDTVVGAYLLYFIVDDDNKSTIKSILNGYGIELSKIAKQISSFVSEAAKRESLRRLSSVMHRLNGPTGRAANGIQDIITFLAKNPEIGNRLIPDDNLAKSRASMCDEPYERHNFISRVKDIYSAIEDIKKVSYQVRRLRLVQGDLDKRPIEVTSLIEQSLASIDHIIPGLRIEKYLGPELFVDINMEVITAALEEVLSNACREMKEHSVAQPAIKILIEKNKGSIKFRIIDNGLPVNSNLIENPFDEDASTYARSGRGSGLGLTIVRETFLRHAGNCKLYENQNNDGSRIPGVTFEATLPEYIS